MNSNVNFKIQVQNLYSKFNFKIWSQSSSSKFEFEIKIKTIKSIAVKFKI